MNDTVEAPKDQTRLAVLETAFTREECLRLVSELVPQLRPASVEGLEPGQSVAIRKSSAVFIFPDASTGWVFERLTSIANEVNDHLYGFEVDAFREGFQFTRYKVGEYYKPHVDIGPGRLTERKLSLTVQLSAPHEYEGGELIVYPEFVAPREQGSMTVFPSFMCHDVRPVKSGVRYSLVSWMAGTPFR